MHGVVWALWAVCGSCFLCLGKDSQQSQLQSSVRDPLFFVFFGLWVVEQAFRLD